LTPPRCNGKLLKKDDAMKPARKPKKTAPPPAPQTTRLTITVPVDLSVRIQALADQEHRSRANMAVILLMEAADQRGA